MSPQYSPLPCYIDLWPWKWCPSHVRVTWAIYVPILPYRPLCSRFRPDVRDRQTSDVRHTSDSITDLCAWGITSCKRAAATMSPAEACNGSAQRQPWARPAEPGPISQLYAPSSRLPAHAVRQPDVAYATDVRQTDVRQHHRLMAPGRGYNRIHET